MTKEATTYRVSMPLIQIQGHVPGGGDHRAVERSLRKGDVVPAWVPADELARLSGVGAIELVA